MSFLKDVIEFGALRSESSLVNQAVELTLNILLDDTRVSLPADVAHVGSTFGDGHQDQFAVLSVWQINPPRGAGTLGDPRAGPAFQSSELVFSTDKFLLVSVSEMRASRAAPIFTFGQPLIYSSGRRPYSFTYSGHLLINQIDGDGRNNFHRMYEDYLRVSANPAGSGKVVLPWIVELAFRGGFRRGYMTNVDISLDGMTAAKADFSFSLFVIQDGYIGYRPDNNPVALPDASTQ